MGIAPNVSSNPLCCIFRPVRNLVLILATFIIFFIPLELNAQFHAEFTNCWATGRFGPTQADADAEYEETLLEGRVTIIGDGIQEWVVPYTATYAITAFGAQGGNGGLGARVSGEFSLTKDDTIHILVGQQGQYQSGSTLREFAAGGGGSFVVYKDATDETGILLIAGGGGGHGPEQDTSPLDGTISNDGNNSIHGNGGTSAGGTAGSGGASNSVNAGSGAGFSGDGNGTTTRSHSFLNGGLGGDNDIEGGFGGGGGAITSDANSRRYAGGGGGYSGGAGAYTNSSVASYGVSAGGGGSYNSGASPDNESGVNAEHGKVVITAPPLPDDAGISFITAPVDVASATEPVEVWAVIKNYGSNNLTSVSVHFDINEGTAVNNSWSGDLALGEESDPVYIGEGDFIVGTNTLRAWTSMPNGVVDHNNSNDTVEVTIEDCEDIYLGGTITVGSTGDYSTIGDALSFLYGHCGISGPVLIELQGETFNERVIFTHIAGSSRFNTITLRGTTGTEITYANTVSNERSIVFINSAKHIRIENLTIRSLEADYGWGVHLNSNTQDIQVRDCLIDISLSPLNANLSVGIVISGSNTIASPSAGTFNVRDVIFENNTILGGYTGITIRGAETSSVRGLKIMGNTIDNQRYHSIPIRYTISPVITGNYITNIGYYGIYMMWAQATEENPTLIANNSIGAGITNPFTSSHTHCVGIWSSEHIDIFHNSFHFDGPQINTYGSNLRIFTTVSGLDIRNNTFVESSTEGGSKTTELLPPGENYKMVDHNNWRKLHSASGFEVYAGYLGSQNNYLSTLRNNGLPFGFNQNCVSGDPAYLSTTYLRSDTTVSRVLLNSGTPIARVPKDILGNYRNPLYPDIGAYEHNPPNIYDAGISQVALPETPIPNELLSDPIDIWAVVKNFGVYDLMEVDIYYTVNEGPVVGPYEWEGSLFFYDESAPVNIGSATFLTGVNIVKVWTENPNGEVDENPHNDTLIVSIYGCYDLSESPPDVSDMTIDCGSTATIIPGCGADTYEWFSDAGGVDLITIAETFTTHELIADATYYVSATTLHPLSGSVTFTNCHAFGPEGPTQEQADFYYRDSALEGEVIVEDGIQKWVAPVSGIYTIHAYGASGGGANEDHRGKGGYAYGDVFIEQGDTLYISVGQSGLYGDGLSSPPLGGFNGGGDGGSGDDVGGVVRHGSSGGGASDVRVGANSLFDRVIVAAGGGGGAGDGISSWAKGGGGGGGGGYYGGGGGHGGGVYPRIPGGGGTQDEGGEGGGCDDDRQTTGLLGQGGYGGNFNSTLTSSSATNQFGGDGGGLEGVAGNNEGHSTRAAGGGGGSSYIEGLEESGTETGANSGHGYVIISYSGTVPSGCPSSPLSSVTVFVQDPTTPEIAETEIVIDCGETITIAPTCGADSYAFFRDEEGEDIIFVGESYTSPPLVDDVDYFVGSFFREYPEEYFVYEFTNCGATGSEGPSQEQANSAYLETTLEGNITIVEDGIQQWIVEYSGIYAITAYGAEGGPNYNDTRDGGLGGMAKGTIELTRGDIVYIAVGQAGELHTVTNQSGGWNGGGGVPSVPHVNYPPGTGGGASDVRIGGTSFEDRILVAAGGGGASRYSHGGHGGGLVGEPASSGGTGGTQTEGGDVGGLFGLGGHPGEDPNAHRRAPGGGGYYGGGASPIDWEAGGGGSSYIGGVDDGETTTGVNEDNGYITFSLREFRFDCISPLERVSVEVIQLDEPDISGETTISCGETAELTASGSSGDYVWFADEEGTIEIGRGTVFETNPLSESTTIYVSAFSEPSPEEEFSFTNCGATGRFGPSQIEADAEYTGTTLEGEVTIIGDGIQEWTVPETGIYRIDVYGAQGGESSDAYPGGLGAAMRGDFSLERGQVIQIIVGQEGLVPTTDIRGGGGGGGSFVWDRSRGDLLIAAGGGGGAGNYENEAGINANATTNGNDGLRGTFGIGGIDGDGGGAGNYASGGAGWFSDGEDGTEPCSGGISPLNGGIGGAGYTEGNGHHGGFGGGGGSYAGAGGGGGYSGGGAGGWSNSGQGGGGGSFNIGENQDNESGVREGHGLVVITAHPVNCYSETIPVEITVNPLAEPIVTGDLEIVAGETATLDASGSSGNYIWFADEAETDTVAIGSSFTSPPLMENTTYYVVATSIDFSIIGREYEFTNCGATGSVGPTQIQADGAYTGTTLEGQVGIVEGGIQKWTAPVAGTYAVEVYGAQGGLGGNGNRGGYGGMSRGTIELNRGDTIYIAVGHEGEVQSVAGQLGGWNGGGDAFSTISGTASYRPGTGGGASDIRLGGTTLEDRIIVAAGGGGAGGRYGSRFGGHGGGLEGESISSGGDGGTQTEGGALGGDFGIGGNAAGNLRGAGGGGYFGGGASTTNYYGGGGGSSYIAGVDDGETTSGINEDHGRVVITCLSVIDDCVTGQTVVNVIVNIPPGGGSVSGPENICAGSAGNVYTYIDGSPIADGWSWSVPEGAEITAGEGTASITVTFGSTSGNVTCTPSLDGLEGDDVSLWVDVYNTGEIGTWTGYSDINWNNPQNWAQCQLPDAFTDVIIPPATNNPTINDEDAVCRSITIESEGKLNGGSGILTVHGDWENNGTFDAGTGTIVFSGSSEATIYTGGTDDVKAFYNFEVNCGESYTKILGGDITINGNFNITSGGLDVSTDDYHIILLGDWTNNGIFFRRNGTVHFIGSELSSIFTEETFHNLEVDKTGTGYVIIQSDVAITGQIDLSAIRSFTGDSGGIYLNAYQIMLVP